MKYLFGGSVGLLILSTVYLVYEGKIKNEEHPEPDAAPAKEPDVAPVEPVESAKETTKEPAKEPAKEEDTVPPSEIP